MKLVTAVVQPHRLDDVKEALTGLGMAGLTVTEVSGHGAQKGHAEVYRGAEYRVEFRPKVRVDVVVSDADLETVLDAVTEAARTGRIGDGKIWATDLVEVVRVRTGERGESAV
ncbi:nitrogen regulatory protein PII [Aeromicrobium sp. SORGH_AS981]|uniref:P-II family nitrogen regulator n=1 Tax=Aeromicrobium sp. SORGH_AS_0981 TaxID=3041802 RepID=UPI002855282C|nr:P-II family nitrogen regulator [Aeromicrobium sp. SORGH_AS_0981]MDR6118014.1 nitrogen regulatory protein PII [Aeromicrobium sp. SORGH_AS_0981]